MTKEASTKHPIQQQKTKTSTPTRSYNPIPFEGEDGLFRQSWHALCKSGDLPPGGVIGRNFLDGRVAIYRGMDGKVQVLSAYCPHIGADLSIGRVRGNSLQCAFHHWEFNRDGFCERTGIGDPAPRGACLFKFPTIEKFGLVWAFNGEDPLFELADLSIPIENTLYSVSDPLELPTDPWVICSNTPDWVHFDMVHRFEFPREGQESTISFDDYGVRRKFTTRLEHGKGEEISFKVTVSGTNLVLIEGVREGKWFAVAGCMSVPRPGKCAFHIVSFIDRTKEKSDADAKAALEAATALSGRMGSEDAPIWQTMHFKAGLLTKSDRALAKYLDQLRRFPRAHPSADFIN